MALAISAAFVAGYFAAGDIQISQRLPMLVRKFVHFGFPLLLIGVHVIAWCPRRFAPWFLLVAGFIWLALPWFLYVALTWSFELGYVIALPLGLVAGGLVAWARPRWTWLQFRLRTLFLLAVVCGATLAAFDYHLARPAREQAALIATIEQLGGEVKTEPGFHASLMPVFRSPLGREIGGVVARRYYRDVTAVTVRGSHADEILAVLPRLRGVQGARAIRSLSLNESSVTDEGLSQIAACRHLMYLYLRNTAISDAGLVHLRECSELEQLDVSFCPDVTDGSVAVFQRLPRLRSLNVDETRITAAGGHAIRNARPDCTLLPVGDHFFFNEHRRRSRAAGVF